MITLANIIAYANDNIDADTYNLDVNENHAQFTFEDFEGFDEDWEEEYNDAYDDEAVDNFYDYLDGVATSCDNHNGMYPTWHFEGFSVTFAFTSYDI